MTRRATPHDTQFLKQEVARIRTRIKEIRRDLAQSFYDESPSSVGLLRYVRFDDEGAILLGNTLRLEVRGRHAGPWLRAATQGALPVPPKLIGHVSKPETCLIDEANYWRALSHEAMRGAALTPAKIAAYQRGDVEWYHDESYGNRTCQFIRNPDNVRDIRRISGSSAKERKSLITCSDQDVMRITRFQERKDIIQIQRGNTLHEVQRQIFSALDVSQQVPTSNSTPYDEREVRHLLEPTRRLEISNLLDCHQLWNTTRRHMANLFWWRKKLVIREIQLAISEGLCGSEIAHRHGALATILVINGSSIAYRYLIKTLNSTGEISKTIMWFSLRFRTGPIGMNSPFVRKSIEKHIVDSVKYKYPEHWHFWLRVRRNKSHRNNAAKSPSVCFTNPRHFNLAMLFYPVWRQLRDDGSRHTSFVERLAAWCTDLCSGKKFHAGAAELTRNIKSKLPFLIDNTGFLLEDPMNFLPRLKRQLEIHYGISDILWRAICHANASTETTAWLMCGLFVNSESRSKYASGRINAMIMSTLVGRQAALTNAVDVVRLVRNLSEAIFEIACRNPYNRYDAKIVADIEHLSLAILKHNALLSKRYNIRHPLRQTRIPPSLADTISKEVSRIENLIDAILQRWALPDEHPFSISNFQPGKATSISWWDDYAKRLTRYLNDNLLAERMEQYRNDKRVFHFATGASPISSGNLSAVALSTPFALIEEGTEMKHCVWWDQWVNSSVRGTVRIFSIRDAFGMRVATLAIEYVVKGVWHLVQCYGQRNSPVSSQTLAFAQQVCDTYSHAHAALLDDKAA